MNPATTRSPLGHRSTRPSFCSSTGFCCLFLHIFFYLSRRMRIGRAREEREYSRWRRGAGLGPKAIACLAPVAPWQASPSPASAAPTALQISVQLRTFAEHFAEPAPSRTRLMLAPVLGLLYRLSANSGTPTERLPRLLPFVASTCWVPALRDCPFTSDAPSSNAFLLAGHLPHGGSVRSKRSSGLPREQPPPRLDPQHLAS